MYIYVCVLCALLFHTPNSDKCRIGEMVKQAVRYVIQNPIHKHTKNEKRTHVIFSKIINQWRGFLPG